MTTIAGPGIDPARIAQVKTIHAMRFGPTTEESGAVLADAMEKNFRANMDRDAKADALDAVPSKTARELDTEARAERYGVAYIELVGVIELIKAALPTDVGAALFGGGGPVDQLQSVQTRILVRQARAAMKGAL